MILFDKIFNSAAHQPIAHDNIVLNILSTIYHLILENAIECLRISEFCEKPEVTGFRYFLNIGGDFRNPCFVLNHL